MDCLVRMLEKCDGPKEIPGQCRDDPPPGPAAESAINGCDKGFLSYLAEERPLALMVG